MVHHKRKYEKPESTDAAFRRRFWTAVSAQMATRDEAGQKELTGRITAVMQMQAAGVVLFTPLGRELPALVGIGEAGI